MVFDAPIERMFGTINRDFCRVFLVFFVRFFFFFFFVFLVFLRVSHLIATEDGVSLTRVSFSLNQKMMMEMTLRNAAVKLGSKKGNF